MVGGKLTTTPKGGIGNVGMAGITGSVGNGMGRLMVGGNGGNAHLDISLHLHLQTKRC
jgi:hypothetical protein